MGVGVGVEGWWVIGWMKKGEGTDGVIINWPDGRLKHTPLAA